MSDTDEVRRLPQSLKDKILETEFGKNWRNWRWWKSQFTPTSATIIVGLLGLGGRWIISLSHQVDNQGVKITILETQVVPDLKLAGRVSHLEATAANHSGRLDSAESNIRSLQGQLGKFDYPEAIQEADKIDAARRRAVATRANKR